jgi:hypothetical protein
MQKIFALSFKELKQRISIEQVLQHYGIFSDLHPRGKSHRGPCPFCEADGTPFSVSLEKNCYQCFACKTSGNILEFVMKWEGIKVREAGQLLAKTFLDGNAPREPTKPPPAVEQEASPAIETQERTNKVPQTLTAAADEIPHNPRDLSSPNEPLTFALKNIDTGHPSVKVLGIPQDILTAFGVGYYSGKGMMGNRIVIPIYNARMERIAYAGFHPEERTYTYPPQFRKELELYNLAGAVASDWALDQYILLVRHPLEALMLISMGYTNTIALMGETIATTQMETLLEAYSVGGKITLFWPYPTDIVSTLSDLLPHFFVRLIRYEAKGDHPIGFTMEEARELLA